MYEESYYQTTQSFYNPLTCAWGIVLSYYISVLCVSLNKCITIIIIVVVIIVIIIIVVNIVIIIIVIIIIIIVVTIVIIIVICAAHARLPV